MTTERELAPAPSQEPDYFTGGLSGGSERFLGICGSFEDDSHANHQVDGGMSPVEPKQKAVKNRSTKKPSTTVAAMQAKEFAIHKRSTLTNTTPHLTG